MSKQGIYSSIIEQIFQSKYKAGIREVAFEREDIVRFAKTFKIDLPKNLGDLVYSFRYRATLPDTIQSTAGENEAWIIRPAGRSKYCFVLVKDISLAPNPGMAATKVPDATPGIVTKYAFNDEQALLAKLRYNRLIDIFTGVTSYSLQNHLRTTVQGVGQVETDEIYVGVDKRGAHYVFPIQAKGGKDRLSVVQIEQDIAVCGEKFPNLICRPLAAQFMEGGVIALFELEEVEASIAISVERHYQLVPPEKISDADLKAYRDRTSE